MSDTAIAPESTPVKSVRGRIKRKSPYVLPRAIFRKIVKEIVQENKSGDRVCIYADAYEALQTVSEDFITQRFYNANVICDLMKNKTLQSKHFVKFVECPNSSLRWIENF
jgi:histone H3/H4